MKDYLKVVKKSIIAMLTNLAMLILFSAYVGLFLFLFTLSDLFAIPFIIITALLMCCIASFTEDNSMENYWTYVAMVFIVMIILIIIVTVIVGILALIIWLLRLSFWMAIPILIIAFLIYTYAKYREEKKLK